MKLQGSAIEEDGNIQIQTVGETTLQHVYAELKNFFELNHKIETFEILRAVKEGSCWNIRCYYEAGKQAARIVSVQVSVVGGIIQSVQEEFRAVRA